MRSFKVIVEGKEKIIKYNTQIDGNNSKIDIDIDNGNESVIVEFTYGAPRIKSTSDIIKKGMGCNSIRHKK